MTGGLETLRRSVKRPLERKWPKLEVLQKGRGGVDRENRKGNKWKKKSTIRVTSK